MPTNIPPPPWVAVLPEKVQPLIVAYLRVVALLTIISAAPVFEPRSGLLAELPLNVLSERVRLLSSMPMPPARNAAILPLIVLLRTTRLPPSMYTAAPFVWVVLPLKVLPITLTLLPAQATMPPP